MGETEFNAVYICPMHLFVCYLCTCGWLDGNHTKAYVVFLTDARQEHLVTVNVSFYRAPCSSDSENVDNALHNCYLNREIMQSDLNIKIKHRYSGIFQHHQLLLKGYYTEAGKIKYGLKDYTLYWLDLYLF